MQVDGRSVPLTEFDLNAAIYGASYNQPANGIWLHDELGLLSDGTHQGYENNGVVRQLVTAVVSGDSSCV